MLIAGVDRRRVTRGMTMGQKVSGGVKGLSGREGSHSSLGGAKPSNSRHEMPHDFTKPSRLEALLDMPPTSRYLIHILSKHYVMELISFFPPKIQGSGIETCMERRRSVSQHFCQGGGSIDVPSTSSSSEYRLHSRPCRFYPRPPRLGAQLVNSPARYSRSCRCRYPYSTAPLCRLSESGGQQ